VTVLLGLIAPPLAVVAWILLSGDQRKIYWQSPWVRAGLRIPILGALPLLLVIIASQIGLSSDPNPNPIGLGLLFVLSVVLGVVSAIIGVARIAVQ
jgi:hypothetical protein